MIDLRRNITFGPIARYLARELLTELWLPARPVVNTIKCDDRIVGIQVQLCRKQVELLSGEVIEKNLLRHIEWRQLGLGNKADRIALAQQHERKTREIRIRRTRVVCCTNAGEQLVRERQILDALNLVDKYNDRLSHELQNDFRVELQQSLAVTQDGFVMPPGLQVITNSQLS